jgi:hypothetical protein
MKASIRSFLVSAGVVAAVSIGLAGVSSAASPTDNTPELNYLRSCVAGLSELASTVQAGAPFPMSCDDFHVGFAKPADVTSSTVWRNGAALMVDVTVSGKSHLRFNGKEIELPASYNPPAIATPRMRMQTECGPSRCCTDSGYCCNWATGGAPICGYGR